MKIIGVHNIKGGVGKTTTAVNLAAIAATAGARVLVCDLDPQAAATFFFRVVPKVKGGRHSLTRKSADFDRLIKGTDYPCLDLLPADFSYRKLDLIIGGKKKAQEHFIQAIGDLEPSYDVILIDCSPGISVVAEAVFRMADALLVPVIPTTLSVRTLESLVAFLAKQSYQVPRIFPFFSMLDRRKTLHRETTEWLWKEVPSFLRTAIPNSALVERMGVHRAPITSYAPMSELAQAYELLWQELQVRLRNSV